MINIKELSGHRLRKDLCLKYVVKRWHNHNKTGGNFGINLITGGEINFEITGYHNIEGKITTLQFKHLYGQTIYAKESLDKKIIDETITYDYLINLLNPYIKLSLTNELINKL
jgi:hypothetical protein